MIPLSGSSLGAVVTGPGIDALGVGGVGAPVSVLASGEGAIDDCWGDGDEVTAGAVAVELIDGSAEGSADGSSVAEGVGVTVGTGAG